MITRVPLGFNSQLDWMNAIRELKSKRADRDRAFEESQEASRKYNVLARECTELDEAIANDRCAKIADTEQRPVLLGSDLVEFKPFEENKARVTFKLFHAIIIPEEKTGAKRYPVPVQVD